MAPRRSVVELKGNEAMDPSLVPFCRRVQQYSHHSAAAVRYPGIIALAFLGVAAVLSSPARADDMTEAREHYKKGTQAFELGEYAEAMKEYSGSSRDRVIED